MLLLLLLPIYAAPLSAAPLWRGAPYSTAQRDAAVLRGLDFIFSTSGPGKNFTENVSDYLWCFYSIGKGAASPQIRKRAIKYGRILARRWMKGNAEAKPPSDADDVADMATCLELCEKFGVPNHALRAKLEKRIASLSARDFLKFDPAVEPPPNKVITLKGKEACIAAGKRQTSGCPAVRVTIPDYDIWYDALITVFFGERFGKLHGATLRQLMRWHSRLLPYKSRRQIGADAYHDLVYLVTHIVYAHTSYSLRRISPSRLPHEYAFLKKNFALILADGDAETFAEFVENFRSFGHKPEHDPQMARAIIKIMKTQNKDGSWGDPDEEDVYNRYHFTWTAICALMDYRFAEK